MRSSSFCLALLCLLPVPVLAQGQTPPAEPVAQAAPEAAKPDPQQKICVDQNPTASTRVNSQRICRTREEWEKRGGVPR